MKTLRISAALFLYEHLLANETITKEKTIGTLNISSTTFKRLVSDLRCYLMEQHPDEELFYNRVDKTYRLKNNA